jgi:hypothetical protein
MKSPVYHRILAKDLVEKLGVKDRNLRLIRLKSQREYWDTSIEDEIEFMFMEEETIISKD